MPFVFARRHPQFSRRVGRKISRKLATRRGSATTGARAPRRATAPSYAGLSVSKVLNPRTWFDNTRFNSIVCIRDYNKQPYANSEYFHIKGSQFFSLSGTIAGLMGTTAKVIINDLAHPWVNPTGVDHDPYGSSQLGQRYKYYKVFAATIKMTFLAAYATTSHFVAGLQSSNDSYTWGSETTVKTSEKPGAIEILGAECNSGVTGAGAVGTAGALPVREFTVSVSEVEGLTKQQFWADNDDYCAQFGSSPSRRMGLTFGCGDINGNNNSDMSVKIDVIFHGRAFERQTQNAS